MTASLNISVLNSHIPSAAQNGNRKGFRSSNRNMYKVEVVDFDNEVYTFEVEADSPEAAQELGEAWAAATSDGLASYVNVYKIQ